MVSCRTMSYSGVMQGSRTAALQLVVCSCSDLLWTPWAKLIPLSEYCGVHGRALPGPADLTVMLSTSSVRFRIASIARLNWISFLAGMWNGNSMALEYPGWNYNSCSLWLVSSLWLQKDFFEPEVNIATYLGQLLFYMEWYIFILLI